MNTPAQSRSALRRVTSCALLLGVGLLPGACDKQSPAEQAINQAGRTLAQLETGTGAPPAPEFTLARYEQVRQKLTAVEGGTPAQQAAASLLIAETHLGEGSLKAREAAGADQTASQADLRIRSLLSSWGDARSDLEVARAFDPTDRLERIETELERSRNEQSEHEDRIANLESQIEDLQQRRDELLERAEAKRDAAAEAELDRDSDPSPESLDLLRKIELHRRSAGALRLQVENLQIRIDALKPAVGRLQRRIEQARNEQTALKNARERIDQRASDAEQEAADARERANDVADRIAGHLFGPLPEDAQGQPLATYRQQTLTPLFEEATNAYDRALTSARAARQELRPGADTALSRATARLWSLHLLQWRGQERYLSLLQRLANVPSLPTDRIQSEIQRIRRAEAETIAALSDAVGDEADQSLAQGLADATEQAAQAAESGDAEALQSALSDARSSLEQIIDARGAAARDSLSNRQVAAVGAGSGSSSGSGAAASDNPDASQGASANDRSSPQAVLERFIRLVTDGRMTETTSLIEFENQSQRQAFNAMASVSDAVVELDNAALDQFGERISDALGSQGPMSFEELAQLSADDLNIQVQGDTATTSLPGTPGQTRLRRDGQQWIINGASALGPQVAALSDQQMQNFSSALDSLRGSIADLTSRVRNGEFSSAQTVRDEINALRQQMLQQPGTGGG